MEIFTITTDCDGEVETNLCFTKGAANHAATIIMLGNWIAAQRDAKDMPDDWTDAYEILDAEGEVKCYVSIENHDLSTHPIFKRMETAYAMVSQRAREIVEILNPDFQRIDNLADIGGVDPNPPVVAVDQPHADPASDYDNECVTRSAPRWAWEIIDETLDTDSKSNAFSTALRTSIEDALIAMVHTCETGADFVSQKSIEAMRAEAAHG